MGRLLISSRKSVPPWQKAMAPTLPPASGPAPKSSASTESTDWPSKETDAKGPSGAVAPFVDRPSQPASAGAGFAANQNRRAWRWRCAGRIRSIRARSGWRWGNRTSGSIEPRIFCKASIFRSNRRRSATFCVRSMKLGGLERLGKIIACAAFHRLDRGVDRRIGGDDDDPRPGILLQQTA